MLTNNTKQNNSNKICDKDSNGMTLPSENGSIIRKVAFEYKMTKASKPLTQKASFDYQMTKTLHVVPLTRTGKSERNVDLPLLPIII